MLGSWVRAPVGSQTKAQSKDWAFFMDLIFGPNKHLTPSLLIIQQPIDHIYFLYPLIRALWLNIHGKQCTPVVVIYIFKWSNFTFPSRFFSCTPRHLKIFLIALWGLGHKIYFSSICLSH